MERKFYTDDFERLLKEKSDEFRMYPSKRVWSSIYNDLHPGRKWPSVAVSLLLIFALFITGYWNSNNNSTTQATLASVSNKQTIAATATKGTDNNTTDTQQQNSSATSIDNSYSTATAPGLNTVVIAANKNNTDKANSERNNTISTPSAVNKTKAGEFTTRASYAANKTKTYSKHTQVVVKNVGTENSVINKFTSGTNAVAGIAAGFSKNGVEVESNNVTSNGTEDASPDAGTAEINNITTAGSNTNTVNAEGSLTAENNNEPVVTVQSTTAAPLSHNAAKKSISAEDKAWMDDYAMYNKSNRKNWKERLAKEFYITPGAGFRSFSNNSGYDASATNIVAAPAANNNLNSVLNQKPGISIEAGMALVYSLSKKLRIKAGIQANYGSYVIYAQETNHPVLTTLSLNDVNTGNLYLAPRTATLANSPFSNPLKVHNRSYQVSIPIGLALKLAGNDKFEWYAAASIQPTYVARGKANVISSDRKYYVSDPSLLRHWNLNSGVETYISYKFDGFNLQVGPQFRYQLASTYSAQYTLSENLYNVGLKIGILKNF